MYRPNTGRPHFDAMLHFQQDDGFGFLIEAPKKFDELIEEQVNELGHDL